LTSWVAVGFVFSGASLAWEALEGEVLDVLKNL
jgi:hypothetical protein